MGFKTKFSIGIVLLVLLAGCMGGGSSGFNLGTEETNGTVYLYIQPSMEIPNGTQMNVTIQSESGEPYNSSATIAQTLESGTKYYFADADTNGDLQFTQTMSEGSGLQRDTLTEDLTYTLEVTVDGETYSDTITINAPE